MDGVVRVPSLFSITLGCAPSIMATQELVVPRSMPMTLPMFLPLSAPPSASGKHGRRRRLIFYATGFKPEPRFLTSHRDIGRQLDGYNPSRAQMLYRGYGGWDTLPQAAECHRAGDCWLFKAP